MAGDSFASSAHEEHGEDEKHLAALEECEDDHLTDTQGDNNSGDADLDGAEDGSAGIPDTAPGGRGKYWSVVVSSVCGEICTNSATPLYHQV